ncbi:MAG: zf-TFIIB domain-containing protein [Candidatus Thermoplasmatota archaeon]
MTQLRADRKRDADLPLACPRDGRAMETLHRDGATFARCGGCGGHWLDQEEVRRVSTEDESSALVSRVEARSSPFACPRCQAPCVTAWVGDVRVDGCTACHGVWLDAPEVAEAKRAASTWTTSERPGRRFAAFVADL